MILETAALVSRGIWLAVAGAVVVRRRRRGLRLAWPRAIPRGAALQAGLLALLALGVSLSLSRPCAIWDREWHIPLVASLRGQRLPFMNVYEPSGGLYYHFTGNVLAAMLQAFSGDALHASLALSLAHDLTFLLLGAELGLLLWAVGIRRATLAALVLAATLLAGPVTLLREPERKLVSGHSIVNFLSLSFRPHVSLAYLLTLGFVGFVLAGLRRDRIAVVMRRLWPSLGLVAAALTLTDESSLTLLALGLGALWLCDPALLGTDRRRGLLVGLGAAAVVAVTALLFVGAIGPHAPRYGMALVVPRSPGFLTPPVPFTTWMGPGFVGQDLWSILLVGAGGIALAVAPGRAAAALRAVLRRRARRRRARVLVSRAQPCADREPSLGHDPVRDRAPVRGRLARRGRPEPPGHGGRGRLAGAGHLRRPRAGRGVDRRVAGGRGRAARVPPPPELRRLCGG